MKKALITGASGGIGLEIARQLAGRNYQITMVARNENKLREAIKSLPGTGHLFLVADLTSEEDLQMLEGRLATYKYDVLVNNAGAGIYGEFTDIKLDDHLANMHLNMNTLVRLSYSFLLSATSGDALVNIGSLLAHSSLPGGSVYAATKSFVANFSESLWYEYKKKGIFVMSFNPGAADSEFHAHAGRTAGDFPGILVSKVADVARELVHALETRQKPRVVQGWQNRLILFGFRFLSRKSAVNIMGQVSPGVRK